MKLKTLILSASLAILGPIASFGDTGQPSADAPQVQPIGPFGGLNTNLSQEAIDATQSPDLLNVDITQGGKSVKKRQGYGLDTVLASTEPAHNLYKFFDSSGNEIRLAFNDQQVSSSVNGATWSVILTTGTKGATWDCTDYLGFAYCVSSSFDNPIKTNGTSGGTSGVGFTNGVPAGSLISSSGDRLLVGATGANPSRLYYSQSTVFTNFTLGVQSSDSSFEDIVAPGSKLTHIAYRFGRWLWWKDQSFGFIVGTGQFDLQIVTVSNTIGTLDNTDVFDGNYVYFRGSDSQIYTYDGSSLNRAISTDIGPTLRNFNRRKANSWTQTSQTDWQAGQFMPSGNFSTTIGAGDITLSSYTKTDALTVSSMTYNSAQIDNNSFESGQTTNWTVTGSGISNVATDVGSLCTASPQDGTKFEILGTVSKTYAVSILKAIDGTTLISSTTVSPSFLDCTWSLNSNLSTSGYVGTYAKMKIANNGNYLLSDTFVLNGNSVNFYSAGIKQTVACSGGGTCGDIAIDFVTNSPKASQAAVTSSVFDSGITSTTVQVQSAWNTATAPTFSVQTSSANTGTFTSILTSTATNATGQRYFRYISTFTLSASDPFGTTTLSTQTVVAVSTGGIFISAVDNAPSLSSWNAFNATDQTSGGTITYYTRASTTIFTIASATPTWVAQTKNGTVTASTGTYMQARADFVSTYSTSTLALNDFTFNWFEGSASDKMYGTYFNNAIWFSMSLGTTATNNRVFRYDLLANVWTLYDIPSNGFLTYNNNLYFASPTVGKVFQFGNSIYSDNGSAITAYWKSKAFFGVDPFSDKDLRMASWYVGADSGTTLTMTYTVNETTSTITKSLNLYDSRKNIIQNNWNFPIGSVATNFNVQFGDVSTNTPWQVFGGAIFYVPRPWKVSLQ